MIFRRLLFFFGPIAVLSLWQIIFLSPENGSSFIKEQIGWMAKKENWLSFWIKNAGLIFIFLPFSFFMVSKRYKLLYLPFFLIFIITNIIIFQPHDYDNIKIMEYWYLFTALILSIFLTEIWRKNIFGKILAVVIFPLAIFSPVLDLTGLYFYPGSEYIFWTKNDISVAEKIKSQTDANAIFLTSDKHNHLVPNLTGRRILMGFRGWLWTYGINYNKRAGDIGEMFSGDKNAKSLLEKYKVDYVFIGSSEKNDFKANEQFFDQNYSLFLQEGDIKIYKISR